jgi:diguanylate cyclase (GGDEF)-like protein/PAS domain S-box-containing protein
MSSDIYQEIFRTSPIAMIIIQDDTVQLTNDSFIQLSGFGLTHKSILYFQELIPPADFQAFFSSESSLFSLIKSQPIKEFHIINSKNKTVNVIGIFSPVEWNQQPAILLQLLDKSWFQSDLSLHRDYNHDRVISHEDVCACSEDRIKYREATDSIQEVIFEMDLQGKITFANSMAYEFFKISETDYQKGLSIFKYIAPIDKDKLADNINRIIQGEKLGISEYLLQKEDGSPFPAMIHTSRIVRGKKPIGLRGLILDISDRKQAETQLKYLMHHDTLTGLYNRAFFETELSKKQVGKVLLGIIVLDVDGLKLINDTLGHSQGDELLKAIADLMRASFRESDILARIGGDEFAVLLTDIDDNEINKLIRQLNAAIYYYNQAHTRVPLNISCGYVLGVGSNFTPGSLFKEADNNMRKEKLFHSQSNRSAIVQTLKKALEARDFITEGHADRLQNLVLKLTTSIGFPENLKNDLRLFAQFHDIGKVGIPDRILFKNGPLSKEEMLEMRRHPEIGFRIAQSAPELAPIAEWILHHHEWWNGNGYPLGIKGEKIPLACRLLAIVDAFDAMTNDRPYRPALSFSEALGELRKFAGTQFDPELVNCFIEVMSS